MNLATDKANCHFWLLINQGKDTDFPEEKWCEGIMSLSTGGVWSESDHPVSRIQHLRGRPEKPGATVSLVGRAGQDAVGSIATNPFYR